MYFCDLYKLRVYFSEEEKVRRWNEIKIRQHRLKVEADQQQGPPAHIENIMKSGFSMSDIKGLHRNYSEDAVESDEVMKQQQPTTGKSIRLPARPPRKGSLSRNVNGFEDNSKYVVNVSSYLLFKR